MHSQEEIELAPDCNKALEGLEVECPDCEGKGAVVVIGATLHCDTCDGTGKVGWKWEPRWRDLIVTPTGIWMFDYEKEGDLWIRNSKQEESYIGKDDIGRNCFPILPWETIEEILEGLGWTNFQFGLWSSDGVRATSQKMGSKMVCSGVGKTRGEAVRKAVIALGEEMNNG